MIERDILAELTRWADASEQPETARALGRKDRVRFYFGTEGAHWDEERVLDRYELLYEAGLVEEARRDGRPAALARKSIPGLGVSMRFDHRRILATAIARLREAEGRLRAGDYRGVIAKCRDALESAAKYEAAGDVSKGFDLLFTRAFKGDATKPPLVEKIVLALRDHANALGRHEQYPVLPASRSEAEFCYATTVALFSMLSRRLVGEET